MSEESVGTGTGALPDNALHVLGVSRTLRYLIQDQGGVWTAQRAVDVLYALGWKTTAKYPLNMAGNMLNRLCDYGALVRTGKGVYTVDHAAMTEIITYGVRTRSLVRRQAIQDSLNQVVAIAPPS